MEDGILTLVFVLCVIIAVVDFFYTSFELGFALSIKFIMRKLGLYGDSIEDEDNYDNIGATAEVLEPFLKVGNKFEGRVKLNGVSWKAVCDTYELTPGTIVVVKNISSLTLDVERKS